VSSSVVMCFSLGAAAEVETPPVASARG
jgi:hypothetical protein